MITNSSYPLVSIIVITYNSAKYIVEALDSAFNQTYPNIELIISDDCSSDNTLDICKRWGDGHTKRFTRFEIIKAPKNGGVPSNYNRAERICKGDWVKILEGDDILLPDCISSYVTYVSDKDYIDFLFSDMDTFGLSPQAENYKKYFLCDRYFKSFFNCSAREQYKKLITFECNLPSPTWFFRRSAAIANGITNDESIPLFADWPKYINITKKGIKIYLMDKVTVNYRLHIHSISNSDNPNKRPFITSKSKMWLKYQFGYNLRHHPRLAVIKYIKIKQYLTEKKFWFLLESFGRKIDPLYRKLKGNQRCDWDGHYVY
jgi:alpha-1,3-rhamnosyltransferase